MFDTTNQTQTSLNTADECDYGEILDEIVCDDGCGCVGGDSESEGGKSTEGDDLFADFCAEKSENQSNGGADGRYRVVYNGKEMFLNLEELTTNAQKGLNYDHVKNEYDILREQPGARELLKDARESGLSSQAYLSQQKLREKRSRVEDLMGRGISEREALYVTDLEDRIENERLGAERKKPFYDFADTYPDVEPDSIPPEVWQRFHEGMDLVASYALYENEKLRRDVMMHKQNADSSARSVGSAVGSVPESTPDSFLEGLFG